MAGRRGVLGFMAALWLGVAAHFANQHLPYGVLLGANAVGLEGGVIRDQQAIDGLSLIENVGLEDLEPEPEPSVGRRGLSLVPDKVHVPICRDACFAAAKVKASDHTGSVNRIGKGFIDRAGFPWGFNGDLNSGLQDRALPCILDADVYGYEARYVGKLGSFNREVSPHLFLADLAGGAGGVIGGYPGAVGVVDGKEQADQSGKSNNNLPPRSRVASFEEAGQDACVGIALGLLFPMIASILFAFGGSALLAEGVFRRDFGEPGWQMRISLGVLFISCAFGCVFFSMMVSAMAA